jgi:hypothetical protein
LEIFPINKGLPQELQKYGFPSYSLPQKGQQTLFSTGELQIGQITEFSDI